MFLKPGLWLILWIAHWGAMASESVDETVVIASGEQPPQTSAHLPHYGYLNHLVYSAFDAVGIKADFVFLPWARAYKETIDGDFVASSYWYNDPAHQNELIASDTLVLEQTVLFRTKSPVEMNNFTDVKRARLRLGLTRGYTYNQDIWQYARDNPALATIVGTEVQNFKMLLLGRIDVFPAEEVSGWYILKNNFSQAQVETLETLKTSLSKQQVTLMFSKRHKAAKRLLQQFNKGVTIIKQNGRWAKLKQDYLLGEYAVKP